MPFPLAHPSLSRTPAEIAPPKAPARIKVPEILRFWHLSSLDAPTVAVAWLFSFAWVDKVRLPFSIPVLLALICWSVYAGDRMLDARAALRSGDLASLRERHFFHWRHRGILSAGAIAALCGAGCIILADMTPSIRDRNSVLGFAALAYFSGVHLLRRWTHRFAALFSKELLVGILFTAGCILPIVSHLHQSPHLLGSLRPLVAPWLFFTALAWLNCAAINCWESGCDWAIAAKAALLGIAGTAAALVLFSGQPRPALLLLAGSASAWLIALLDRLRGGMTPLGLRSSADLILLTPLALLLPVTVR
jgi:hypothetical protein